MAGTPTFRFGVLRSRGFTLTEMLIAIGIMGIGMTMISAMFPTAIKQQSLTFQDTIGIQICKNGLSVAKACLSLKYPICDGTHDACLAGEPYAPGGSDSNANWKDDQWVDHYALVPDATGKPDFFKITGNTKNTVSVGGTSSGTHGHVLEFAQDLDNRYPAGDTTSSYGSIVMMRPIYGDKNVIPPPNIYQFVSISYKKFNGPDSKVIVVPVKVTGIDRESIKIEPRDGMGLVLGTPVISLKKGNFVYIDKILSPDGTRGRLSQPIAGVSTGDYVGIVVEKGVDYRSPALNVLVSQGAVRRISQ